MTNHDPIVITGCGWITPFAVGTCTDVIAAAHERARTNQALPSHHWPITEQVRDQYPHLAAELQRDELSWITAIAFETALADARLTLTDVPQERLGLVLGCALAGQPGMIEFAGEVRAQSARFVSPIHFPNTVGNYAAGALARAYNIRGPNLTIASGAASGIDAIDQAAMLLRDDRADVILAGGADELPPALAQALADENRCVADAACLFVLERASSAAQRGAQPWAILDAITNTERSAPAPSEPGAQATGSTGADRVPAHDEVRTSASIRNTHHTAQAIVTSPVVDSAFPLRELAVILACTGHQQDDAIDLTSTMGDCLGAASAAALAAAFAAATGCEVPIAQANTASAPARWSKHPAGLATSLVSGNPNQPTRNEPTGETARRIVVLAKAFDQEVRALSAVIGPRAAPRPTA